MKLALATLLAALDAAGAASSCACKADELDFKIDCDATDAMLDALAVLKTNSCATACTSELCAKNYYIVQSHHDFCPEANVPEDVEDGFHDYDEACTGCDIKRSFTEGAPDCPAAVCTDGSGNEAYARMAEAVCGTDCSAQACKDDFLTLRVVHDDCPHDTLTSAAEDGLHDMENSCKDVVCNAVDEGASQTVCVEDPHGGHDHGGGAYEWAGIFKLADGKHVWSMQKVGGKYADPTMRLVLFPTDDPTRSTMESLEDRAAELIEMASCEVVEDGGTMTPASGGSCFELHVNSAADDSKFDISTPGIKGLVVFAQHGPTEFERDQHYFKDSAGSDIEPVEGGGHDHGGSGPATSEDTAGDDAAGAGRAAATAVAGIAAILLTAVA